MSDWVGHRPGQHVNLRLTAAGGYQTQRRFSIASAPEDGFLVLTVDRLVDGEVSPYLVDELRVGDTLELRGPIGNYFVWDDTRDGPVMLIAGGSGIVPFRSMLRHRVATGSGVDVRLLYSARSLEVVIYRDELMRLAAYDEVDIRFVLTREWRTGGTGIGDGSTVRCSRRWPGRPRTDPCTSCAVRGPSSRQFRRPSSSKETRRRTSRPSDSGPQGRGDRSVRAIPLLFELASMRARQSPGSDIGLEIRPRPRSPTFERAHLHLEFAGWPTTGGSVHPDVVPCAGMSASACVSLYRWASRRV